MVKKIVFLIVVIIMLFILLSELLKKEVVIETYVKFISEDTLYIENNEEIYEIDLLQHHFKVIDYNGNELNISEFNIGQKIEINHDVTIYSSYLKSITNINYIKIFEEYRDEVVIETYIKEIRDNRILVENDNQSYQIEMKPYLKVMNYNGSETYISKLNVGQKIKISYTGALLESYPHTIANIYYIKVLKG